MQWVPKDRNENVQKRIVQLILFIVDSVCTKHMTGNLKLLCNFVEKYLGLNHNLFSVGQFWDADLEVAFWRSTCFVKDLHGNDLLTTDAHAPSQQELDLLFGPLYDEFFTAASSALTYVHAEENNDDQAEEDHLPVDEFTNPFCAPTPEVAESSSHNIDAKKLLEDVEKRFGRNTATKKTQRNLLKQQYENFIAQSLEMLDQTFDRLQNLVSQLELLEEKLTQEDVN
nr:hypothetical protein [Tanacetum cinerariifolium]